MRFCLIHGSTQSPRGWDLLARELMAWGASVVTVDMPIDRPQEGVDFYARQVADQIPAGEPPVVVAHSAAGLILPAVARRVEAARLIYLAALIPESGVSLMDQFRKAPQMFHPDWPGKNPVAEPALAEHYLFHDCEPATRAWALTTLRLWNAQGAMTEPCAEAAPDLPTSYISCTADRTINPIWWERAATERLHVAPTLLDSGHAPHVSQPRELGRLLTGHNSAGPSK